MPKSNSESDTPLPPQVIKNTLYTADEVTYMADDLGLHKISNPNVDDVAVSLHLYTPPNAAREGCNIFDERTGKRSHVTQSNFYSAFGNIIEAGED
ncbi:Cysteine dioxygenase protein [Rutstroemia sp. NJR-2017a BBW]|nr:Cysteine dioxygenase protein [Rutstroemia sp. NJR-2017a BBW]